MKEITQSGASIEEAVSLALQKLGVARERVDVEILQEGRKGFLGFGTRKAQVRVTHKDEQPQQQELTDEVIEQLPLVEEAQELSEQEVTESLHAALTPVEETVKYIENVVAQMGIDDSKLTIKDSGKQVLIKIDSARAAQLIGKRGQTLNALQQLAQLVLSKSAKDYRILQLDVGDYREKRKQALIVLADRTADKAVRFNKPIKLEPMPSYERKAMHHALVRRLDVETYSEGTEPNRYLVIAPL